MFKPLNLFPGGEEGVYARMAEAIREGLHIKVSEIKSKLKSDVKKKINNKEIIQIIAQKLYVDADRLMRIYRGEPSDADVDYELFDRLEFPLDLSIHQVLGKPEGLNNNLKHWFEECRTHYILPAAGVSANNRRRQQKATSDDELKLYVTLRAISELLANSKATK